MRTIEPIMRIDLAFSLLCLQHRFSVSLARVSRAVSHTGDGHLYLVFGVLAWWLEESSGTLFLVAGLIAFAIELPTYWVMKNCFKRRRPQEFSHLITSYITPSDRYSLPSGHTAAAFLMATLISCFFPELAFTAFMWAGLIALSRILLGVHFLSDVVIGALLGVLSAQASMSLIGVA